MDCLSNTDVCLQKQLLEWKQNGHILEVPKVILLGTFEGDKAKGESLVNIVIMKPLSACSMVVGSTSSQNGKPLEKRIIQSVSSPRKPIVGEEYTSC